MQKALEWEKQNDSKLATLQNFNQELLSVAEKQHSQLGAQSQAPDTNSESDTKEHQKARTGTATASEDIKIISQQCTAFLKEAVLNTVPGSVNVKRRVFTWTSSISSEDEEEANLLRDMVVDYQLGLMHLYQEVTSSRSKNH